MNDFIKLILAIIVAVFLMVLVFRFFGNDRAANDLESGIDEVSDSVQETVDDAGRVVEDAVD